MDQANQPPSGEKSTLQVSHPARPSRDGGRLVFSSRISAGSDAGEEERRGNMNSAGDRFIFPWQVSGSYLPLSFPIFLPPSPLGRACFLEVSPGTAAWLRSVAMTAWPSSDTVLNKSGTYMSLVAPRCFPWSTSCPSFTFFALWLTSRKRRPCLRRLCHVRTQLGLCVVYSNRTLFVCQVENVRKNPNVHLISCCLTHSLPLAAIVSQRSHVFLRLRNLIKALTRHTPFMKL